MNLTICLITKGREEYIEKALKSYEKFIETGDVNIILIDNGSTGTAKQILLNWKSKYEAKVQYVRSESNEPVGVAHFWEKIKSLSSDWILFPSDDDILVFDIYEEWRNELSKNVLLNAFAASAQVIDVNGRTTGEVRSPSIIDVNNKIMQVAKSIHEPPFLWPCLFIRIEAIPIFALYSGFVFDWWVGLQLVLKNEIKTTNSIGIQYRVHDKQASFQTSNRRKFFEGFNMLSNVINSDEFKEFLESLNVVELKKLFTLCIEIKPLYAQSDYFIALIKELAFNITKLPKINHLAKDISEAYLFSAGVYTKKGDLERIYDGLNLKLIDSIGNISLHFEDNVCKNLNSIKDFFDMTSHNKVHISCHHSNQNKGNIFIDCKKIKYLNMIEICDLVLVLINQHLEESGILNFTVTPFEKKSLYITES